MGLGRIALEAGVAVAAVTAAAVAAGCACCVRDCAEEEEEEEGAAAPAAVAGDVGVLTGVVNRERSKQQTGERKRHQEAGKPEKRHRKASKLCLIGIDTKRTTRQNMAPKSQ